MIHMIHLTIHIWLDLLMFKSINQQIFSNFVVWFVEDLHIEISSIEVLLSIEIDPIISKLDKVKIF